MAISRILPTVIGIVLVSLAAPPSGFGDASTGPGRLSARTAVNTIQLPRFSMTECPGVVASVEILKGAPRRILVADATIQPTGSNDGLTLSYSATFKVNGHRMQPTDPGWNDTFGGTGFLPQHFTAECPGLCSAGGTAWLDLDEAESGTPGEFYGKPLVVTLEVCDWSSNAEANVSLGVRLDRK